MTKSKAGPEQKNVPVNGPAAPLAGVAAATLANSAHALSKPAPLPPAGSKKVKDASDHAATRSDHADAHATSADGSENIPLEADGTGVGAAMIADAQAAQPPQGPATADSGAAAPAEAPDESNGISTPLIIGGVLLGGAGIALAAGGGGSKNSSSGDGGSGNQPAVNQPPVVSATQAVTGNEDAPLTVTVSATDANNDTLTYTAGAAAHGAITGGANGVFTYTPQADFNGTDSFTVTVSDGKGGTVTQTVNVTVAPVNDNPAFAAATQTVTTAEDTAVTVTVAATDVDNDALSYAVSGVSNGTVVAGATAGSFVFTPAANFNGASSFVVTASDGHGGSTTQTVMVDVTPVNDAPTIDATATRTITTAEDTPVAFVIDASDVDDPDSALSAQIATQPANGIIVTDAEGNSFYRPNPNFNGTDSFSVAVSDGKETTTYTVDVTVTPMNDAPVFAAATLAVTTNEDTAVTFAPDATDVDGDPLTYTVGQVANGTATVGADGGVTFTPAADFNGSTSFVLTASDGHGGTATQTVNVTVGGTNDAPTFASATQAVAATEDQSATFTVVATDVDGDALTYTAGTATNGTIAANGNGTFVYTPNANFNGTDQVTITAADGKGGTAIQTVMLTVAPVNDAPTFAAATLAVTTNEDTAVTFAPAATDVDGDPLTYTVGQVANGTATVGADGGVTFMPDANFAGATSFVLTASDGHGGTATQTVNVTVVNQPDIINLDTLDTLENGGDGNIATERVFDAGALDYRFDDSSALPSNTQLTNFTRDDVIQVDESPENYNFTANGSDVFISYQTSSGSVNLIELTGVVTNTNVLVYDEATAESAVGFDFFQSTAPAQAAQTLSLDVDPDNNSNTQAIFSGAGFATTFLEDAARPDFVRIDNFGANDLLQVSNAAAGDFNFTSNGVDVFITYQTPGGAVNDIALTGVVRDTSVLVVDEASAEQAVGFNFFQLSGASGGNGNGGSGPPAAQTASLDVDPDSNPNTQAVFDAGSVAGTFTEDANAPDYVRLVNMSDDDRLLVSNAQPGDFNFTSNGTDIFISYQTSSGTVNDITLAGVVHDTSVLVVDEASAERAAGFDFFQFA